MRRVYEDRRNAFLGELDHLHEELILEYKGLLKSRTEYKNQAVKKYKQAYATLRNSIFFLFISACQSAPVFRLESFPNSKGNLHVIQTNSDRVQQKCLFMNAEGDNNWRHQYFIYGLNEKNEVLEIMDLTHIDGNFCRSKFRAVEKILKAEPQVKICARDELRKSQTTDSQQELILFGTLGQHRVTQEGLTFDTICNSKKCVGDNSVWVNTCPGFVKQ